MPRRVLRVGGRGALLLSLTSREAQATCGDYVMIGGKPLAPRPTARRFDSGSRIGSIFFAR